MNPYGPSFFKNNRQNLKAQIDSNLPIVLTAHTQMQCSADMAFPFRQDTNFWYLTGSNEPDLLYVHDLQNEYIVLPKSNAMRDVFDGSIDSKKLAEISGISNILSYKEGWALIAKIAQRSKRIATQLPVNALQTHYGISPNPSRKQLIAKLRRIQKELSVEDIRLSFARLRMIKSKEELTALQDAVDLTVGAFELAKSSITSSKYSYEIEAEMTRHFRKSNAQHAYPPILAGGKSACTLHYVNNSDVLRPGEQILIDVGAETSKGAADITRTYAIGAPSKRLKDVHAMVLQLHTYAMSQLKPGVYMQEYERNVEKEMGKGLKDLGLITNLERSEIRTYFPHATSHFLGLDVHDMADYSEPLAANMVLTVEPGIYIPEEGIGVRIEDDVRITNDGAKNMSEALSTDLC